jgi:cellulose synthase/poly-beta-1,6-N-acetylglucosamine synthase-like glycosyltransferase
MAAAYPATPVPSAELVPSPELGQASIRVQSTPALTRGQVRMHTCFSLIWLAANALFWVWWLQPARVGVPWLFALLSIALAYDATVLPTAYLFFVRRMREPRPFVAPPGMRVALITLCVPSQESLEVIRAQLLAMTRVEYPHDSWVLDEGDDGAVRALAASLGVRYFTRAGIARYNQPEAPFKAKTKAGNVNAWLEAHGSAYDYFVQLDIDHRPRPDYLHRVLGYFRDRQVAWVQAPSTYGNLDNWVARGAAEQELVLQGPLQRGFYGHSETPFIIGSHCTYRMSAIGEIGGFQPTRAEDHLDTVMLAARGYRGVYVPERIAMGLGPDSFETYLRQQFAWGVSMIQVLGTYTPRVVGQLRFGQALQFLFAETWYPLFGLSMLTLFLMPVAALVLGQEPARASLLDFFVASAPLQCTALAFWWWTRRWHVPEGLGLSWRGVVLHIARWPIVLWALLNVLLRVRHPYMITPKNGRGALPVFSLRSQAIYLLGAAMCLGVVLLNVLSDGQDSTSGYLAFAILGAVYMLLVVAVNTTADLAGLRHFGLSWLRVLSLRAGPLIVVSGVLLGLGLTVRLAAPEIGAAATWTPGRQAGSASAADVAQPGAAPIVDLDAMTPPADEVDATSAPADDPDAAATAASPVGPVAAAEPVLVPGRLSLGAYDPSASLTQLPLALQEWYVPQANPALMAARLAQTDAQRIPLITVEPFPSAPDTNTSVLEQVASGQLDDELIQLAHVVREDGPPTVLIRWAQEMDLTLLYPWSSENPALYKAAFRHVVEVFRTQGVTNVNWVWSPAGQGNALAYYPGDDVVDYVGLTVLGDADWDAELGFQQRQSMADILQPRYRAVQAANKPIIITELGVSGSAAEQVAWLSDGATELAKFPLLHGIVYFNASNAANNWRDTQPDWRLHDPRALARLLSNSSSDNVAGQ